MNSLQGNFGSGHFDGESGAEHSYETNGPCGNNTVQETKKLLYTSDNEPSECDPYEDADDSDPAFRNNANDSDSDSNIDQSESSKEKSISLIETVIFDSQFNSFR